MRLLLVGNRDGTNVSGSFERAGVTRGLDVRLLEPRLAMEAPFLVRQLNWRLRGRRPSRLLWFSERVVELCEAWRPDVVIAAGNAAITRTALEEVARLGAATANYLTDDPWSRVHRASWFLDALPAYSLVATPRRSVMRDLARLGCARVAYVPFGYDPDLHFPDSTPEPALDVVFVGGADRDRVPFIAPLVAAGLRVGAYGIHWDRYTATRAAALGQAPPETIRRATSDARVSLCLVRRSNRDGHVMRSFEIPACGGCMLAEDTDEHRELFGPEGEAVLYFRTPTEALAQVKRLLGAPREAVRLRDEGYRRVRHGSHSYGDRLEQILALLGGGTGPNTGTHATENAA